MNNASAKPPTRTSASTRTRRSVGWTESALHDLKWMAIRPCEWRVIRAEVERVAALEQIDLDSAVCKVKQTRGDWFRIKIYKPNQIRVFFSIENEGTLLVVQAVLRRTGRTYDIVELLWKCCKKKAKRQ